MKKISKLMCLAIALLMLLSATACGGGTQKPAAADDKKSTSTDTTAPSSGDQGKNADSGEKKYDEHITITYASVQGIDGYDYTKGDGLARYYSEKFNYTLEVTALTWSNWDEMLRIWINAGDMPDVAVYNYKHPDAASYVEQGLIYRLPDDWKKRWPGVADVYSKTTLGPKTDELFGGTYFLPRARFYKNLIGDPLPNHWSLWMRKDWAEAVGFPVKSHYKISEVLEFCRLVKEKDPGNVGANLLPLNADPGAAVRMFVQSNSTYFNSFYKDPADGKYKWGAASEDTLEGLKLFSKAYREGLLDPDFYTVKAEDSGAPFDTQGISAANYNQAPTSDLHNKYVTLFQTNTGLDPFECINLATVLGEDGYYHQQDLINFWGTIIFSPDIKDKVFERYMDILEYNSTEEAQIILNMGLKDEDWTYGPDGKVVSLYDDSERPLYGTSGKYPSWGYLLGAIVLFDDFSFDNPNYDQRVRDISWKIYRERCEIATPQTFTKVDWTVYTHDSPSMRRASIDYWTELSNLVTMDGDIETNWKNWVQSKMPLIQPVLDELNAKAK
ncbi:MAG: ABC transporter substrate-binding protein [Clostridiaceae bacterium]|nr:ABC transporter substrate-binding protein [Clostridiaceae bacterium]